jgi:hypothetical protein
MHQRSERESLKEEVLIFTLTLYTMGRGFLPAEPVLYGERGLEMSSGRRCAVRRGIARFFWTPRNGMLVLDVLCSIFGGGVLVTGNLCALNDKACIRRLPLQA